MGRMRIPRFSTGLVRLETSRRATTVQAVRARALKKGQVESRLAEDGVVDQPGVQEQPRESDRQGGDASGQAGLVAAEQPQGDEGTAGQVEEDGDG